MHLEQTSSQGHGWDAATAEAQLVALMDGEPDALANLANAAALIYETVPNLNWAGFYLMRGDELVLGPFQGRVACVRIAVGSGVCGTAVAEGVTQRVDDVHVFPGHIACDPRSNSELVVPVRNGEGEIVAVLDLDSERLNNFGEDDQRAVEKLVEVLRPRISWDQLAYDAR